MDFIVGLPRSQRGNDAIWVITDRLTKVAHFIPVKTTYSTQRLAKLYLSRIVCLHGVPKTIISDRGTQFVSKFWDHLQQALGTQLAFSTAYHPRLTKVAHFIPVKTTYSTQRLAKLYLSRIVCLHGVPKTIISDRGTQFVSKFWDHLQQALGTQLAFSTAYHP